MNTKAPYLVSSEKPDVKEGIWPILNVAPNTIESIAPKRAQELFEAISKDGDLTVLLKDSRDSLPIAFRDTRTVGVTHSLAECLWCAGFTYLTYRIELDRQNPEPGGPISLKLGGADSLDIAEADYTLKRALFTAVRLELLGWRSLPTPVMPKDVTDDSSLEERAGDLLLEALGFILHQQLAHIHLGHTAVPGDTPFTLEQEKEADALAIESILKEAPDDATAEKRCFAIAMSLVYFTTLRIERYLDTGPLAPIDPSYPLPYDRMDAAIQLEMVRSNPFLKETLTRLASAALVPSVKLRKQRLEDTYDDYASLYKACIDALTATVK